MKKNYETPMINVMDAFSFETVCAGSGSKSCTYGKKEPAPYAADHLCITCLRGLDNQYFQTYWNAHWGEANYEANCSAEMLRAGRCPAGYTY